MRYHHLEKMDVLTRANGRPKKAQALVADYKLAAVWGMFTVLVSREPGPDPFKSLVDAANHIGSNRAHRWLVQVGDKTIFAGHRPMPTDDDGRKNALNWAKNQYLAIMAQH